MKHFKPFFYIDESITGDWKRIFVEPDHDRGGVHIEIMGPNIQTVSLYMPPVKFFKFADKCIEASMDMDPNQQDWVGERI